MSFFRQVLATYVDAWQNAGAAGQRFLISALFFAIRILTYTVAFPLYATALGYSPGQVGLLVAATTLSLFAFGIPITRIGSGSWNRRIMVLGPLVGASGMLIILTSGANAFWLTIFGCLISGMSSNVFWILGDPLLAASAQERNRPQIFALKFALLTIGFGVGGALGGWIPALASSAGAAEVRALSTALMFVIVLDVMQSILYRSIPRTTVPTVHRPVSNEEPSVGAPVVERFRGPAMIGIFLLLLIPEMGMAIGYNSIRPFLSLFFRETFGVSTGTTGTLIGSMQLLGGFCALLIPSFAMKMGNVHAMAVLRFLGGLSIALILGVHALPIVVLLFFTHYAMVDGTSATFVTEAMSRLPAIRRTSFAGLAAMVWSFSSSIAAATSGYLQGLTGDFTSAFSVGLCGYALSVLWLMFAYPRLPALTIRGAGTGPAETVPGPSVAAAKE
jgi:MFS family permease